MFSLQLYTLFSILLATVTLAGTDGWHLDYANILVNEELDPIVSPNAQSGHMHKVIGGSAFGASYNYDTYSAASCTSLGITADKSNYWMPQLYWIDTANQVFVPFRAHIRFYYFLGRNDPNTPVKPFPKGLQMLVGNPSNKSPGIYYSYTCQVNPDFSNSLVQDNFNFARDCPYGLKTDIFFPQCWDGVNLYTTDGSHMTYPVGGTVRDGSCPISHPVRLPTIQLEYTWATSEYSPGVALAGNLAWSMGDTTGYGIHADFVNGWDLNVLGAALNSSDCVNLGYAIPFENCPILNQYMDLNAMAACTQPSLGVLKEPQGNTDLVPITALPGCNPLWGNGTKPTCNPAVAGLDVTGLTGTQGPTILPQAQWQDLELPTTPGWSHFACVKNQQSILGAATYSDPNLSVETCQASCLSGGYPYAAVGQIGSGWNCLCGTGVDSSAPYMPNSCTAVCPGNSSELCGGSYLFDVYYAANGTVPNANVTTYDQNGAQYLGCYNNPSNGLNSVSTYSFSSSSMTIEVCTSACANRNGTWATIVNGRYCYCGSTWQMGTGGTFVNNNQCTVGCTGNSTEICGDVYKSSVYNISTVDQNHNHGYHPTGYQGCYSPGSGQALANFSYSSSTMVAQDCVNSCSQLQYSLAGVVKGSICYCGNTFNGGQNLPVSQCNYACGGNSTQYCGGTYNIDLYSTANATTSYASQQSAKGAGWVGCYSDGGQALTNYSYTSTSMTPDLCKNACAGFGYPYAGVENRNTCKCGTLPTTNQGVSTTSCNWACAGNSSQICGGNSYLDVYNITSSTTSNAVKSSAYLGCYTNVVSGLASYSFGSTVMTNDLCMQSCKVLGYGLSGTVGGGTCYCGNTWTGGQVIPDTSCTSACLGNSTTKCGASQALSLYNATYGAPITGKPSGWFGCYSDSGSNRVLQGYSYSASPMSASVCRAACAKQNYTYAGTQNGVQCWCGNTITSGGSPIAPSLCSTGCAGNSSQTCGGSYRNDMYYTDGAQVKGNGNPGYYGCYNDYSVLNGYSYVSDYMSEYICASACGNRGFAYSGVQNGKQCLCGNTAPVQVTGASACSIACSANSTQSCGGTNTATVYSVADSGVNTTAIPQRANQTNGYVGCFREGTTRVLTFSAFTSNTLTTESCVSACAGLGYAYAGTEFANQCFCGSSPSVSSGGYQVLDANCNMACKGNSSEVCGGNNMISIYNVAGANVVAQSAASVAEGYKGCYLTSNYISKAGFTYTSSAMTSGLCRRTCRNKGYSIAAVTNGNTCGCSNDATTYGTQQTLQFCSAGCFGNSSDVCGALSSAGVSVFDTTGAGSLPPSTYPTGYVGCYGDQTARSLPGYTFSNNGMTSAMCMRTCTAQGYTWSGTENGYQCFCGSALPPGGIQPDASCGTACKGLSTETCGGGWLLSTFNNNLAGFIANTSGTTTTMSNSSTAVSTSSSVNASTSAISTTSGSASASASVSASSTVSLPVSSSSSSSASASASASASSVAPTSTSSAAASSSASSSIAASSVSSSGTAASSASSVASSSASASSSMVSSSVSSSASSSAPASSSSSAPTSSSSAPASSSSAPASSSSAPASSSSAAASSSSSSASSASVAPSSSSSQSPTSTSSSATPSSTDSSALGCFAGPTPFSTLNITSASMTPTICKTWCSANSYKYAGVANGNSCGCTNDISAIWNVAPSQCSVPCSGSSSVMCGGSANSAMGVWSAGSSTCTTSSGTTGKRSEFLGGGRGLLWEESDW